VAASAAQRPQCLATPGGLRPAADSLLSLKTIRASIQEAVQEAAACEEGERKRRLRALQLRWCARLELPRWMRGGGRGGGAAAAAAAGGGAACGARLAGSTPAAWPLTNTPCAPPCNHAPRRHPDRHPGGPQVLRDLATEVTKMINEAVEQLGG
jgi:hypothetical protein